MTIEVKVIADSISEHKKRITTLELRYPRFIHAEFMTHRVFSRNASSSRAIPTKRMLDTVTNETALPVRWVMNEPGMQGYTEAPPEIVSQAEKIMATAVDYAVEMSEQLEALGLHKQHVNRLTEPFQHIRVVLTSTEWYNFFRLRSHETAEPTMQALSDAIGEALEVSNPRHLDRGSWHLPYVNDVDREMIYQHQAGIKVYPHWFPPHAGSRADLMYLNIAVSAARCARTSYQNFEGKVSTVEEDIALFNKLIQSQPIHASPVEHQACPDWKTVATGNNSVYHWANPSRHGNLVGWQQARKYIPGEDGSHY